MRGGDRGRDDSVENPVQADHGKAGRRRRAGLDGEGLRGRSAVAEAAGKVCGVPGETKGVRAQAVRRPDRVRAGEPGGHVGPGPGRGRRAGPDTVQEVPGQAARCAQLDAVRHGCGESGGRAAGRAGRDAGRDRVAVEGGGGVQVQWRGPGGRSGGHRAARGQARRGRCPDRRQEVHGRAGCEVGRRDGGDAGRGSRLRGVHPPAARRC